MQDFIQLAHWHSWSNNNHRAYVITLRPSCSKQFGRGFLFTIYCIVLALQFWAWLILKYSKHKKLKIFLYKFKEELKLWLTSNPGLALTGFWTNPPSFVIWRNRNLLDGWWIQGNSDWIHLREGEYSLTLVINFWIFVFNLELNSIAL